MSGACLRSSMTPVRAKSLRPDRMPSSDGSSPPSTTDPPDRRGAVGTRQAAAATPVTAGLRADLREASTPTERVAASHRSVMTFTMRAGHFFGDDHFGGRIAMMVVCRGSCRVRNATATAWQHPVDFRHDDGSAISSLAPKKSSAIAALVKSSGGERRDDEVRYVAEMARAIRRSPPRRLGSRFGGRYH